MLSQQSGQVSLCSNLFVSAPSEEVPDLPPWGSTWGKTAESLSSRSIESPSGVVPLPPQDDVLPPTHVSVSCMSSVGLAGVSGVPSPSLGISDPFSGRLDQLRDRGDLGFTRHIVSADVHHVPRSLSLPLILPLLFPFSDSRFSSLSSSAPHPLSSFSTSLSSSFSVSSSTSLASSSTVPIFSLPSIVPSVLSAPLPSAPPLPPSSSFSVGPPPGFSSSGSYSSSSLASSAPSFPPAPLSTPLSSAPATSWGALPFSSASSVPSPLDVRPVSSSSTSSPSLDFAAHQANVLGLLAEYQELGRWYFASGGKDFPAYLSAHFPHLYSDFRLYFSSGASCFLFALSSAPPLVQVPAAPAPSPLVSSSSLTLSFSVYSSSFSSVSSLTSAAFPFFTRPEAPAPSDPLPPQAPSLSYPPGFHPSLSSSPSHLHSSSMFPAGSSLGAPVAAGLAVAAHSESQGVSSTLSFFQPFVSSSTTSSVPSAPSAPPLSSSSAGVPPSTSSFFQSAPSFDPASSFGFASADDLRKDSPRDAVPRVLDPGLAAVPEAARLEFRRMLAFIVDLFPQAVGSPSVPPPPRALFEDFFSSSTPSSPIYLNWFERVRSALSEADYRLASFVGSGHGDFLLPSRSPVYAVHGAFALGGAAPVNPSLLTLLDRRPKPSHHLGLSIRKAAAFEGSLCSQSEALSHSMWVLSSLLAFVRLQHFAPEDAALFNNLVTSLSKSLAHRATHTAFLGLKRRQFFSSHLPSYFSEVSKWAMLSSPVVLASSLFAEEDVTRLLAEIQTSSSLRSQQVLVEVVSSGAGAQFCRSSPARSPSRPSPSRHRRRESGSPSHPQKRVRFDSPAPSSALRGNKSGFRK